MMGLSEGDSSSLYFFFFFGDVVFSDLSQDNRLVPGWEASSGSRWKP
jgi:hypothetical protein